MGPSSEASWDTHVHCQCRLGQAIHYHTDQYRMQTPTTSSRPSWRTALGAYSLAISAATITCLPVLRGFLQTPEGDELTFLAQHHEALSLSKGISVWWPTLSDGPPSHLYPLATLGAALLYASHRVLAASLEISAGSTIGLFNFLLLTSGAGIFSVALTRSMGPSPRVTQHLRVAVATSLALVALFTTGNSGGWNSFTTGAISGWFPAFLALAFSARLSARVAPRPWRWAVASVIVGAIYGPAVVILIAGVLAQFRLPPSGQWRSAIRYYGVTVLAASTGLLMDFTWTLIYRNALSGNYEGVTPVKVTQLPRSFIGSIASNLNGVDSIDLSSIARVGPLEIGYAMVAVALTLAVWRAASRRQDAAHRGSDPDPASRRVGYFLRVALLLGLLAGTPYVASAKYANDTFSAPTSQYFNSVFVMTALVALLASAISEPPKARFHRTLVVTAVGSLVLVATSHLEVRSETSADETQGIEALDRLIIRQEGLGCADLAPLFLNKNSAGLADVLSSISEQRSGDPACPPYSDNLISTMHLVGGVSEPEFDESGWWFWLGSGSVTFQLELRTTDFAHVDIPLAPASCSVGPPPSVSADRGELLNEGVLRLDLGLFEIRPSDTAVVEFTLTPQGHACLFAGDSRPLSVRVGMPMLTF